MQATFSLTMNRLGDGITMHSGSSTTTVIPTDGYMPPGTCPQVRTNRSRPSRSVGSVPYPGSSVVPSSTVVTPSSATTGPPGSTPPQNMLFKILSGRLDQSWMAPNTITEGQPLSTLNPPPFNAVSDTSAAINCKVENSEIDRGLVDNNVSNSGRITYAINDSTSLSLEDLTAYRQRSQSMSSNFGYSYGGQGVVGGMLGGPQIALSDTGLSRTSSHDSLVSFDSFSGDSPAPGSIAPNASKRNSSQSERLLEMTRSRLMCLLMGGEAGAVAHGEAIDVGDMEEGGDAAGESISHPGSPPLTSPPTSQLIWRKFSEGSQQLHLRARLRNLRAVGNERYSGATVLPSRFPPTSTTGDDRNNFTAGAVDLSRDGRRRKPYSRPDAGVLGNVLGSALRGSGDVAAPCSAEDLDVLDEGIDDAESVGDCPSILKQVLMMQSRGRSYSLTVPRASCFPAAGSVTRRQRVQLARKNLQPIIARISDRLSKVVEFAKSLPEFTGLSLADQKTLLISSCPRLLLLYMAEMNLQFAVTPVHIDISAGVVHGLAGAAGAAVPTLQFVEGIQSFVRKCQSIGVSANEYFYMRMIALFHTGTSMLENGELASRIHSEARQDLQELVQHAHPEQKQRYFTLLLTLHSLFGVNCAMLQALFCDHLWTTNMNKNTCGGAEGEGGARSLEEFICERLQSGGVGVACPPNLAMLMYSGSTPSTLENSSCATPVTNRAAATTATTITTSTTNSLE